MMPKRLVRFISFFVAVIVLVSLISYTAAHFIDFNATKDYINSFGIWVPLIIFVTIVITSSIGFVFTIPVAISALLLDLKSSFIISLIGLTIGAMISFLMARRLGRSYVEKRFVNRIKRLDQYNKHLKNDGFLTILFLRFILLIPYEVVNIAAGLSRVGTPQFLAGTMLGIIPGAILTIYVVKSTAHLGSMNFFIAASMLTLFSILPLLSKRIRKTVFNAS